MMDSIWYSVIATALFVALTARATIHFFNNRDKILLYLGFMAISVLIVSNLYHIALTDPPEQYGENTVENFSYEDDGVKKSFQNIFDVIIYGSDAKCDIGNQVEFPSSSDYQKCGDDLTDSIYLDTYEFTVALTVLSLGLIAFIAIRAEGYAAESFGILVWTIVSFILYASGYFSQSGYAVVDTITTVLILPFWLMLYSKLGGVDWYGEPYPRAR
tara:strand:+ start:1859 stop:2503 length:645 start_codon:yes stop_codon:yes gene_type:complete